MASGTETEAPPLAFPAEDTKGRITVFTISGCPHCRSAKSLLKKKGVPVVEINLDVYPERREDMEARAHQSSAPQVFLNERHVGGNEQLQDLERAGQLDALLQEVRGTRAPDSAPQPPGKIKAAIASAAAPPGGVDGDAELVSRMRAALPATDHLQGFFHLHRKCFPASAALDWLCEDQKCSREEAAELGKRLLRKHFLHPVERGAELADGPGNLFRFLENHPGLAKKGCLNFHGIASKAAPGDAPAAAERLRRVILAIYDEFLSEDGTAVDYRGIAASEAFKRYQTQAEELQRLELAPLPRDERLAFFINVYNALVVHAMVARGGAPANDLQRHAFFSGPCYLLGGSTYTLNEIENGVLRANRRPPYALQRPFHAGDPRLEVALEEPEPLVHFALVCGARSCPPIRTYVAAGIRGQLEAAARSFLEGEAAFRFDAFNNIVHLSKIFYWYRADFGETDEELLRWVARYIPPPQQEGFLLHVTSEAKMKVVFQPYDWGSNSA